MTESITLIPSSDEENSSNSVLSIRSTSSYNLWNASAWFHQKSNQFVTKVAFIGSIGGLLFGYDMGVVSQALPLLKDEFDMTIEQMELFTSLLIVGGIFGCLVGGYICDIFGRKFTMILVTGIFILGSLVLALSKKLEALYVGRLIVGCGVTLSAIADVSYLSEISPEKYRGAIVGCNEQMITIGLLFAYFTGYLLSAVSDGWRWMFALPIFMSLIWLVSLNFVPESPIWYLLNGNEVEALKIFQIRVETEIEAQTDFQRSKLNVIQMKAASEKSLWETIKLWKFSIITSSILMIFMNLSGNFSVLTYSPELFHAAGFEDDASKYWAILLGIAKVVCTAISMFLVDKVGRKTLLVAGGMGMSISLLGICIFVQREVAPSDSTSLDAETNSNSGIYSILTLVCVCGLTASFSFGYGPMNWLVTSELFASDVRGRGIGVANIAAQLSSLLAAATFLSLLHSTGTRWTFFIYFLICISGLIFIIIFLPETKNKIPLELLSEMKFQYHKYGCVRNVRSSNARSSHIHGTQQNSHSSDSDVANNNNLPFVKEIQLPLFLPSKINSSNAAASSSSSGFNSISKNKNVKYFLSSLTDLSDSSNTESLYNNYKADEDEDVIMFNNSEISDNDQDSDNMEAIKGYTSLHQDTHDMNISNHSSSDSNTLNSSEAMNPIHFYTK